jgi:serine/threonine-protein kinase
MSGSGPRDKDSVTEVAEESFVRARPPEIERGSVLAGRYQVEDIIGKGGSGIVLRVFDRTAQNVVALKVLKSELALDAKWDKRFSRELRLGRPIQHPNVCRIFDIGEADGYRFLTMELAAGGSLRDELKRNRSANRPLEERMADAKMAVAGLTALHAGGVVHRDFKPDNLLRMGDGRLVISDFGLATDAANAPGATVLIATPHYMAPEVLAGEPATTRSDVWALGVVLYEVFFGQRPERRSVSFDGSARVPLRPTSSTERRMLALCEACLAESPLERPAEAGVVARMFESTRPRRWSARSSQLVKIGVGFSIIAGAIYGGVWKRQQHNAGLAVGEKRLGVLQVSATGEPMDWSKTASIVAELPGGVHCFSLVGREVARVVWGTPRRAEDVDLRTRKRRAAEWLPEVYRFGCPDVSRDGMSLLSTTTNRAGAMEVRLSTAKDGGSATNLTSGFDPEWLGGTDEFVYNVDNSHAAIFSMSTMSSTFLPSPAFGEHHAIAAKSVSRAGNSVAELLYDDKAEAMVAVLTGNLFEEVSAVSVPKGSAIWFADDGDDLLVSEPATSTGGGLVSIDWRRGRAVNIARYPGFDFAFRQRSDSGDVAIVRRRSRDAWLRDGPTARRLTFDGKNYTAAMSATGVLLLSKRADSGAFSIWRQTVGGGSEQQLTDGPGDVAPSFSQDGNQWTYADYTRRSIMLCSTDTSSCRVLREDRLLPGWPVFSPGGDLVAYLTQLEGSQLKIVSTKDGSVRASWDAHPGCPPVWSSASTVWSLESSPAQYAWSERTVTGTKTGNRLLASGENLEPGEIQCSPKGASADSPWFRRVDIRNEDSSKVLVRPFP